MDIFEILKKDHELVRELFKKIEGEQDFEEKKRIFQDLKRELTTHAKAEQEVFYEPLRILTEEQEESGKRSALVWEGEEEHHVVCLLLNEISRVPQSIPLFDSKLRVLKELVLRHVEQEEEQIFKVAREQFSEEETKMMGENMEQVKEVYREVVDEALAEDLIYLLGDYEEDFAILRDDFTAEHLALSRL